MGRIQSLGAGPFGYISRCGLARTEPCGHTQLWPRLPDHCPPCPALCSWFRSLKAQKDRCDHWFAQVQQKLGLITHSVLSRRHIPACLTPWKNQQWPVAERLVWKSQGSSNSGTESLCNLEYSLNLGFICKMGITLICLIGFLGLCIYKMHSATLEGHIFSENKSH